VSEAAAAGVGAMLAVSVGRASSERTAALDGVLKAVGVHPTRADDGVGEWLAGLARGEGVVAIGECGFDDAGPAWEVQRAVFEAQCEVARELRLALVLHVDGAEAWRRMVEAGSALEGLRVVRHYFAGGLEQAQWHAERGHWLSFGRPLLRDAALREVAAWCPPGRLLIETDSYPLPGRATEPKHLVEVGAGMAELRGWTLEECAERLAASAGELGFGSGR
jgi:TatD DNase family protein